MIFLNNHLANYQATLDSHRIVPVTPFTRTLIANRATEIRRTGLCDHHAALRTAVTMRVACMDDMQRHSYLVQGTDMLLELVCHVVLSSHRFGLETITLEENHEAYCP